MDTLHKLINTILSMCEPAYAMLRGTLVLSCTLVFCSLVIFFDIGVVTVDTYDLYLCALELAKAPVGLILVAAIGTVFIEERETK